MEKGRYFTRTFTPLLTLHAVEKNREARKRALIEWLAAPDIAAAHLSAQDQKEEGTGEWFLESQEFLEWANTGRSMWLAGDGLFSMMKC